MPSSAAKGLVTALFLVLLQAPTLAWPGGPPNEILQIRTSPPADKAAEWGLAGVEIPVLTWVSERVLGEVLDEPAGKSGAEQRTDLTPDLRKQIAENAALLLRLWSKRSEPCLRWVAPSSEPSVYRFEASPPDSLARAIEGRTAWVATVEEITPGLSLPLALTDAPRPVSLVRVQVREVLGLPGSVAPGSVLHVVVPGGALRIGSQQVCAKADPARPVPAVGDELVLLGEALPGHDLVIAAAIGQVRDGLAHPPPSERFAQEPVPLSVLRLSAKSAASGRPGR